MMNLPPLPKKRVKREAGITGKVLAWFKDNHNGSCAIEIKATDRNTIAASELKPHQKAALIAATGSIGLVHKISDQAQGSKPFDAFMLSGVPAYVVACHTKMRICLAVPVEKWRGINFMNPESHVADVDYTIEI